MPRDYDDDRVVVIDRDRAGGLGMLLLGLAVGAGVALLFAPASGRETRHQIARGARKASRRAREFAEDVGDDVAEHVGRARRRARELTDEFRDEMSDRVDHAREVVGERVERARDAVEDRVERAREVVGTRTRAVRDAVDVGRVAAHRARNDMERNLADTRAAYAERRSASEDAAEGAAKSD